MASVSGDKGRIFYGWVVVAALMAAGFIMMGVGSSFGVFFRSLEEAFSLTRATTSSVLSVRMVFSGIFAISGGWAIDRHGPRKVFSVMGLFIGASLILTGLTSAGWQLFITYGVLISAGVGAVYVVITSTLLRWFDKKRGLALGISGIGSGLGTAALSPLTATLIDSLDWRLTMILLGGLAWLVVLPTAQFLKKDPAEIGEFPDGEVPASAAGSAEGEVPAAHRPSLLQVARTSSFWAFLLLWAAMAFSSFFINTHIVPHAMDIGFSSVQAATILSVSGLAMIAGRLVTGIIADRSSPRLVAAIASLAQAVAFFSLLWVKELWLLYLFGLVHGFTFGGFGTSVTVLIGRTFRLEDIGKILGVLEIGIFVGGAIGPYLGGAIFDSSGSYSPAFVLMGSVILARLFLLAMVRPERAKPAAADG